MDTNLLRISIKLVNAVEPDVDDKKNPYRTQFSLRNAKKDLDSKLMKRKSIAFEM